jgi:hypothetical protein
MHGVLGIRQINPCRKVPLQVNCLDDDILHGLLWVFSFFDIHGLFLNLNPFFIRYFQRLVSALTHVSPFLCSYVLCLNTVSFSLLLPAHDWPVSSCTMSHNSCLSAIRPSLYSLIIHYYSIACRLFELTMTILCLTTTFSPPNPPTDPNKKLKILKGSNPLTMQHV